MLGYSVSYFLGEYWSQQPLYAEKLIPLLDYILNNSFTDNDKMSSAFYELINKYQNTADLPVESIKEYVKENGYGYILDLLNPSDEGLKIIVYLLVLIHQLKGREIGIETVLSIFQLEISPTDTEIIQWFENTPVAEENTFKVDSKIDVSKVNENFFINFNNFIKNYVYPELKEFKVRYNLNAEMVYLPYSTSRIVYSSYGDLD